MFSASEKKAVFLGMRIKKRKIKTLQRAYDLVVISQKKQNKKKQSIIIPSIRHFCIKFKMTFQRTTKSKTFGDSSYKLQEYH